MTSTSGTLAAVRRVAGDSWMNWLATAIVALVSLDGESNWFEGAQLIAVYLILAIAFYFVPA